MVKKKVAGKWVAGTLAVVILLLAAFAGICVYVDPFCHYHKPLRGYDYSTADQAQYVNPGLIKTFDYDGVITGTSMTDNFKTSEAENLFGGKFIKVPLCGGYFKDINYQINETYALGKHPQYVIRSLDIASIAADKDTAARDIDTLDYLYNDDIFDDVDYLFNFDVFYRIVELMKHPKADDGVSFDFDKYCSWDYPTGKDAVKAVYSTGYLPEKTVFTSEDREQLLENIHCNITDVANAHPETTFICFFPPYSICVWARLHTAGSLQWTIDADRILAEELLKCPNIKLFGFDNHYDMICNLDNYRDAFHYSADINSEILKMMANGTSMLTPDNYEDYFNEIEHFYGEYDYSRIWE